MQKTRVLYRTQQNTIQLSIWIQETILQHGFDRISDNIHRLLDVGNYVIGIFIDFTKAFDTVDHEILLNKLYRYGIRGHANNLFLELT